MAAVLRHSAATGAVGLPRAAQRAAAGRARAAQRASSTAPGGTAVTWTTTLKVAPIFTFKRVADPAWHDREMYEATALRFMPRQSSVPLLVDHDADLAIGVVTDLWRLESFDGP